MENIEEINKMIEVLYQGINKLKLTNKIVNDEINSLEYDIYILEQKIKKETTAQ